MHFTRVSVRHFWIVLCSCLLLSAVECRASSDLVGWAVELAGDLIPDWDSHTSEEPGQMGTVDLSENPEAVYEESVSSEGFPELIETESSETEEGSGFIPANVYSLLVIGSDRREAGWYGNSDVMILVTVNHSTRKIYIVSFMRDLQADIPGYGVAKLNEAYAAGGPSKLVETLESNFGVRIDNYAAVDWKTTAAIIDLFGGVDLEIQDYEIDMTNDYTYDTCTAIGADPSLYHIDSSGWQHLAGPQAVGYSRVRFVGNNDYERTDRHRRILTGLLRSLDFTDIPAILLDINTILDLIDHDLSAAEIISLAPTCLRARSYELVTDRVPFDDMFWSENEMLIPVQPDTNERLWTEIYAAE